MDDPEQTGQDVENDADRFPPDSGLKQWLLLDGSRYALAGGITLGSILLFLLLGYRNVFAVERTITPMLYLFSALIGGNITLITIVVTITQLILARELRTPRELRTELESAEEYRETIEAETGRPDLPEGPAEFLYVLLVDTQRTATALDVAIDERDQVPVREEVQALLSDLQDELSETRSRLESAEEGVFPALSVILDAPLSTRINHLHLIRGLYDKVLSETEHRVLDDLEQNIKQLDVARQYLKTLHIEQELAETSNEIMGAGLVATILALVALVVTGYARTPLSPTMQFAFVPLAIGINLVPLALLISHVTRIATVAKRTAAITPFITPSE